MTRIDTIIFDLGGVLIDWNPEYVYLDIFKGDTDKMHWFFDNICTFEWNEAQDAGRSMKEATEILTKKYPDYTDKIVAYYDKWEQMLRGSFPETVEILRCLIAQNKYKIIALTNWSAETFPVALEKFNFLHWFSGIVVSGEEGTRKPFSEIYQLTLDRYNIIPERAVFIDDNLRNVIAAQGQGIQGIHYQGAIDLVKKLRALGIDNI